jgi:hypothetical protein
VQAAVHEREPDSASLASVIPLPLADRRPADDETREDGLRELARHARFLQERYGDRWLELPETLGRALVRAEALLASGPVVIDPAAPPNEVISRARTVARAAAAIGDLARDETEVLEHALGSRLVDLPLHRLSAASDAVLDLSDAPHAEPAWAWPAAAKAADVVLAAHAEEIRDAARLSRSVYDQFTEQIWDVSERRLRRGTRLWRPLARLQLRRSLASASRTMRAPRPLNAVAELVLHANAARAQLTPIASLLASHLGVRDRGPFTDFDAAQASLAAVRDLQAALGDRLDPERLERLLAADAFKNAGVVEPARNLRTALRAWATDVAKLGGNGAFSTSSGELSRWAAHIEHALPTLESAVTVADRLGRRPTRLHDLVDDLLARERFHELTEILPGSELASADAGSAS